MHFSDNELIVLSIIDLLIVYVFCILQISYNSLTIIYIKKAKNIINRWELWRAYLFACAPIVYSILPILLVLYFYIPSNNINYDHNFPGKDFAIQLIYIHLSPIIIVFIIIIVWNIFCTIHNQKYNSLITLKSQDAFDYDANIKSWDVNTRNIFRKGIYKWFLKIQKKIVENKNNEVELLKILAKIEGWYIAKQRFQFFWCTKKRYTFIKEYYYNHYITLINELKKQLNY